MSLCLFWSIETDFQSIKIFENCFNESLSVSIDWSCFSINWNSWIRFFKNSDLTCSIYFFKLSSLSPTWQGSTEIFCHFWPIFLQVFSLPRPVRPLYPSFCIYFHVFMHKLMHFLWDFWNFSKLGFLLNQSFFSKIDCWVLFLYYYIHDICWLIWSIWGFVKNWKF